jgi:hypothetical protein
MGHAFADRRWPENFPSCTGVGRESDDPVEAKWKSGWAARRRWPWRPTAPEDEMTGAREGEFHKFPIPIRGYVYIFGS